MGGMSFISRYIAYIKDNPEGYWFKRKVWGWGWVPARWAGWLVIIVWVAILGLGEVWFINRAEHVTLTTPNIIAFIVFVILMVAVLIWVCYKKGEKPKWSWGFKD